MPVSYDCWELDSYLSGCGDRTRTCDLRVMSPTSYQLLYSAIFIFGAGDRTRTGTVLLPGDFKSPVSTIPPHRRISAGIIVPHTGGKVKGFSKIYFKGRGICNWTAHGGCCKKGRTKVRRNMVRCSFFDFFCLRPPGILAELAFLPQIL